MLCLQDVSKSQTRRASRQEVLELESLLLKIIVIGRNIEHTRRILHKLQINKED